MRLRPLLTLVALGSLTALGACGSSVPAGLDASNAYWPDAANATVIDSGCPHLAGWEIYDPVENCVRPSGITLCTSGVGPPRLICSIGLDGNAYRSGEGEFVPGGQACPQTEELTVLSAPHCEDRADAGPAGSDAGAVRPDAGVHLDAGTPCPGGCDDQNPCTEDFCDLSGACQHYALANGTNCADDDLCNGAETCVAGACTSGAPLDCDDGNVCTAYSCDPVKGCQHPAVSDGTSCGSALVCLAGNCELFGTILIATGEMHTCALGADGVQCWGANFLGQLGNNNAPGGHVPGPVPGLTSGVQYLSAGWEFNCVVTNGAVDCWGANLYGNLGNNLPTKSNVPVPVSGLSSDVTAVAAGGSFACALASDGVQCWGANYSGQLGCNSTIDSYIPMPVFGLPSDVQVITAGSDHGCAIANGAAVCWGANGYGQLGNDSTTDSPVPVQVSGLTTGVQAIAAGARHTCALVNGSILCWGDNSFGQLGIGSIKERHVPVLPSGIVSGVQLMAAGAYHTCVVMNGAIECFGWNDRGQLGNNTTKDSDVPVPVWGLTTGVQAIAAGYGHTCALVNGRVQCWGWNDYYQLGDGSRTDSSVPVSVQGL